MHLRLGASDRFAQGHVRTMTTRLQLPGVVQAFRPGLLGVTRDGCAQRDAPSGSSGRATAAPNGTLATVGGGVTESLHRRPAELAGGTEAVIACMSTALPPRPLRGRCRRFFGGQARRGRTAWFATPGLPRRPIQTPSSTRSGRPTRSGSSVGAGGGLVEAHAGPRTLKAIHDVLDRGGHRRHLRRAALGPARPVPAER